MTLEQAIRKNDAEKLVDKIHLGIVRDGEEGIKHFTLKRELIKVKPVKFELIDDRYAYIRLTTISEEIN